jgi:hypothetical protein
MTLRPFSIVYSENSRKGKYHFFDHRGQELAIYKKMPKNFLDKLLSYPITAFGYRFVVLKLADYINPKFDKKDVIKALDFWIEYFVYQNKCDYILENTVNKDFELHLEELIRVREAVLKDPTDTKYVRQKIRPPISKEELRGGGHDFNIEIPVNGIRKYYKYDAVDNREITNMTEEEIEKYSKMYMPFTRKKPLFQPASSDQIIEFTENVLDTSNGSPFSTVDQFCYKVKTMIRKEYEEYSKPKLYNKDLAQGVTANLSRMISGMIEANRMFISEENLRHQRSRFEFGGLGSIIRPDEGGHRWVPNENTTTWVVIRGLDRRSGQGWKVVDSSGINVATGFHTGEDAQVFIDNARERFLPSEIERSVPEGTAAFEIRGPDHLLHSNLHPSIDIQTGEVRLHTESVHPAWDIISVPITAQSIMVQDDDEEEDDEISEALKNIDLDDD